MRAGGAGAVDVAGSRLAMRRQPPGGPAVSWGALWWCEQGWKEPGSGAEQRAQPGGPRADPSCCVLLSMRR